MAKKTRREYRYTVEILPEDDGVGYYVVVPALPGCFSQGKTIEDATHNIREAIALHIASLKNAGESIPSETPEAYRTIVEIAA